MHAQQKRLVRHARPSWRHHGIVAALFAILPTLLALWAGRAVALGTDPEDTQTRITAAYPLSLWVHACSTARFSQMPSSSFALCMNLSDSLQDITHTSPIRE